MLNDCIRVQSFWWTCKTTCTSNTKFFEVAIWSLFIYLLLSNSVFFPSFKNRERYGPKALQQKRNTSLIIIRAHWDDPVINIYIFNCLAFPHSLLLFVTVELLRQCTCLSLPRFLKYIGEDVLWPTVIIAGWGWWENDGHKMKEKAGFVNSFGLSVFLIDSFYLLFDCKTQLHYLYTV